MLHSYCLRVVEYLTKGGAMQYLLMEIVAAVISGIILYFICMWLDNHFN